MKDISAVGNTSEDIEGAVSISVDFDGYSGSISFDDLYYEGSPIQFEQITVAGNAIDANGRFYSWRKKSPVVFTISLIPHSKSDMSMSLLASACNDELTQSAKIKVATIDYGGVRHEFRDGIMTASMPSPNVNGDNRMGPRTYRFAFGSFSDRMTPPANG